MDLEEYRKRYPEEDASPGWDAITTRLEAIYPEREWKHWATVLKAMLGGPDPIDGISAFQCTDGGIDHLHFCTYGYTSLYYDEEAVGGEFSRFGFEMTFRLASELPPAEDPTWVIGLLQNLAKYVFKTGNWFAANHYIPCNGPIRLEYETDLVGLLFLNDPTVAAIETPHGMVEFIQGFGVTQAELDALKDETKSPADLLEQFRATNPLLVTDLNRT